MRRTLDALEVSPTRWKSPSSPVAATCVPPHSSRETSSTSTIRTQSPYFSPNRAIAPRRSASSRVVSIARTGWLAVTQSDTRALDRGQLLVGQALAVGEVEAQLVRSHVGARLAHVVAQRRGAAPRAAGGSRCGCAWWPAARPARPPPWRTPPGRARPRAARAPAPGRRPGGTRRRPAPGRSGSRRGPGRRPGRRPPGRRATPRASPASSRWRARRTRRTVSASVVS